MIFETSVQAKFLIPMALSLGFGVLWVTVIILLFARVLRYIRRHQADAALDAV